MAKNRKAAFNYELRDKYEAGLVLTGSEVKSIKTGHISLNESFITRKGQELFLTNANIPFYKFAGDAKNYDPTRPRKVLLRKSELKHLIGKISAEGLTLVPLCVYTKKRPARIATRENIDDKKNKNRQSVAGGLIKLEFAIAKGKKQFDKRRTIAKREDRRRIERTLKNF